MIMKKYLGIDVGGGSIRASVIDQKGILYNESKLPTDSSWDNQGFLAAVQELIERAVHNQTIHSIGIGTPGPIDMERGIIIHSANLTGLHEVPLVDSIHKQFGCEVFFNNDANCASLGEYYFGKGVGVDNLIVLTLGTGLGCGWVYNGNLFNGFNGNGMEAGHVTIVKDGAVCGCGQKGCAESYFSARGFLNRYEEQTGKRLESAKQFFELVEKKEATATIILTFGTEVLAELIRSLVHVVNPKKIVLVGGLTLSYRLYEKILISKINEIVFPSLKNILTIEIGGAVSGAFGAASLGFQGE
jgi:glucokinase